VRFARGGNMSEVVKAAQWQNVLKLLMLTMLSDGRSYERQVDTFVNASIELRSNMVVRGVQTRQMTLDWYIKNRQEIVDIQTGETFENDLLTLIDSLDTIPNKKPLLRALKNLSKRESELNSHDIGIVNLSKERWAS
jgi:hypothetical protein